MPAGSAPAFISTCPSAFTPTATTPGGNGPSFLQPRVSRRAAPDDLFAGGQNWGFRPLHPERIRFRHGTPTSSNAFSQQLRCAGRAPHRPRHGPPSRCSAFPSGMTGEHGVYVRYRPQRSCTPFSMPGIGPPRGASSSARTSERCPTRCAPPWIEHRFHRMYVASIRPATQIPEQASDDAHTQTRRRQHQHPRYADVHRVSGRATTSTTGLPSATSSRRRRPRRTRRPGPPCGPRSSTFLRSTGPTGR